MFLPGILLQHNLNGPHTGKMLLHLTQACLSKFASLQYLQVRSRTYLIINKLPEKYINHSLIFVVMPVSGPVYVLCFSPRLCCKRMPGTNGLAYFVTISEEKKEKFYNFGIRWSLSARTSGTWSGRATTRTSLPWWKRPGKYWKNFNCLGKKFATFQKLFKCYFILCKSNMC